MRRWLFALILFIAAPTARAVNVGDFFIDPNVGVGFNSIQGTVMRFGLDVGYYFDPNWYGGVGAYYAAGNHPTHDREIGAGPFVGYVQPLFSFLTFNLREDVDYVDVRVPINVGNAIDYDDHETFYGVESATTVGLHLSLNRNFGLSGGYRLAWGLSNSDISRGRSGVFFGLSIGI